MKKLLIACVTLALVSMPLTVQAKGRQPCSGKKAVCRIVRGISLYAKTAVLSYYFFRNKQT